MFQWTVIQRNFFIIELEQVIRIIPNEHGGSEMNGNLLAQKVARCCDSWWGATFMQPNDSNRERGKERERKRKKERVKREKEREREREREKFFFE